MGGDIADALATLGAAFFSMSNNNVLVVDYCFKTVTTIMRTVTDEAFLKGKENKSSNSHKKN